MASYSVAEYPIGKLCTMYLHLTFKPCLNHEENFLHNSPMNNRLYSVCYIVTEKKPDKY